MKANSKSAIKFPRIVDKAEWQKARAESEKDGPIVKKVESVYLEPTDYSAIK